MSYHKLKIHKHDFGSPYKIQEEFLEYIDAIATGNKIMAIQELSDLYGCLENEISKYGLGVEDLKIMSDVTKKVFTRGVRTNQDLLSYLKNNYDSVIAYGLGFIQVKCSDINYNFYHDNVERFESLGAPHNHQQDFVSEIIKGSIEETLYDVVKGEENAYCVCGDTSIPNKNLSYTIDKVITHREGDLYLRLSDEYHSVKVPHGTITKVTKYGNKKDAFVISDITKKKKYTHVQESVCWELIEEVYNVNN